MNQKIPPTKVATTELALLFCAIIGLTTAYLSVKKSGFSPLPVKTSYAAARADSEEIFDNTFGEFQGSILASYDDRFPLLYNQIQEYELEKGMRDGIIVLLKKQTKVLVVKRDEIVSLVEVQAGEHYKKKLYVLTACLKKYGDAIHKRETFRALATTEPR
ncbi:hypothetical protein [Telluribacter humicola]|uniref:hypothetical protein n=1 Tax=Telluribacter humicola TaxID=1720261 RepID=UPI001A95BD1E|nr:hypothetical protein [Telluribacter humicola]